MCVTPQKASFRLEFMADLSPPFESSSNDFKKNLCPFPDLATDGNIAINAHTRKTAMHHRKSRRSASSRGIEDDRLKEKIPL